MEYHGPLPRACYFCGARVITFGAAQDLGVVHHLDHNHLNNTEANLVLAHFGCHNRYHGAHPRNFPSTLTEAHRKAIGDGVRGTQHTDEARANVAAGARRRYEGKDERAVVGDRFRGKPKTPEHREKLAAAQRVKSVCPGCGREYNKAWMSRHNCEGR